MLFQKFKYQFVYTTDSSVSTFIALSDLFGLTVNNYDYVLAEGSEYTFISGSKEKKTAITCDHISYTGYFIYYESYHLYRNGGCLWQTNTKQLIAFCYFFVFPFLDLSK